MTGERGRKRDKGLIVLAMVAIVLGGGAIWVIVEVVGDDTVPTFGPSMRPTITGPASVEIDDGAYASSGPERGDIVTALAPEGVQFESCGFRPTPASPCVEPTPDYSALRVIKRVIAIPGDRIAFDRRGHLILDGERQSEPYILECPRDCALPDEVEVPEGSYFLAGDNRPASSDSRYWGPLPLEAIDGRVAIVDGG